MKHSVSKPIMGIITALFAVGILITANPYKTVAHATPPPLKL